MCIRDSCTTGNGARGRLGLGDEEPRHRPVQLEKQAFVSAADQTSNEIIMVAAGSDHSAALASDGSLYTWGDGLSGALGIGKRTKASLVPTAAAL